MAEETTRRSGSRMTIYISAEEQHAVAQTADALNMSMSEFARVAFHEAIEKRFREGTVEYGPVIPEDPEELRKLWRARMVLMVDELFQQVELQTAIRGQNVI